MKEVKGKKKKKSTDPQEIYIHISSSQNVFLRDCSDSCLDVLCSHTVKDQQRKHCQLCFSYSKYIGLSEIIQIYQTSSKSWLIRN